MKYLLRTISIFCLGILLLSTGIASAQDLTIGNYSLVSKTRVSRTEYNYTYQADITNTGSDVQNVTGTLTSNSPHTIVVQGAVSFGDVASGTTVTSADTFTIKQNRRYPLDWSDLVWDIQCIQILGPSGGTFEGENNVAVTVPPGAADQSVPISIEPVQEDELGKDVPPGYTFVGAAALHIGDVVLDDNADVTIPCPSAVPEDAEIYVAKVVEYAGSQMFMMVDTATVQGDSITSQDPGFPGVIDSGTYVFLWADNVGWIAGQVTYTASGDEVPGAVVTLSGGYWLDIAGDNGYYGLPAWAGNFVVVAFDDQTGEHGEKQGYMPSNGASVVINVQIGESSGPVQNALTNGDFETGDLTGWELSGAGDVITSLGPILPYEGNYMAMISSGSGAVGGASSALEQSFTVPAGATRLSIHYNFVSEEYPEWVGSQYNDVFNATLHTPDGSREIAFEEVNSANFQPVSGIPCGSGDCTWGQTGWLTASIDVSQWAGIDDTLTLTVHDVGDTIYDTVVLLDDLVFFPSSYAFFFKIDSPTSEDIWKMIIYLKDIDPRLYQGQNLIYADINNTLDHNFMVNEAAKTAGHISTLFGLSPNTDDLLLLATASSKILAFEATLLGNEYAQIWLSALGATAKAIASGGNPFVIADYIVVNSVSIFSNFFSAFSIFEKLERHNEISIAKAYLNDYYAYGGNLELLAASYSLFAGASVGDIVEALASSMGYEQYWYAEDYETDKVINIIDRTLELVDEKLPLFIN